VPTPFYHLSIAQELLAHPDLSPQVHSFLTDQRCAFFLGKTAPDVQSLSGQSRTDTHFYRVPLTSTNPPWQKLFRKHPNLQNIAALSAPQAAFISGYICHLQADIIWITDLFGPYFLPRFSLTNRQQVGYLHNVLRAYLDARNLLELPSNLGDCLLSIDPSGWLPFVRDEHMVEWRNFIARQLLPNAKSETVEVFAQRMHISVETFMEILEDEGRLESELFSFIPRQVLVEYRDKLVEANCQLLEEFLAGSLH
jgi:hypothetical protein